MDNEVDFSKYGSSLRRARLIIIGAALVCGALGALYSMRSPYQSTFTLQPVERIAELAAAGVPADELDTRTIMEVIAATISSNAGEAALQASVDESVEVSASASPNLDVNAVTVTVSADTEEAVSQAVDEIIASAAELFERELGVTVAGVRADAQRRLAASQERLDAVTELISSASNDQTLLVDGLIVESQKWKADIDDTVAQIDALDSYEQQLRDDVRALGVDTPEKSPGLVVAGVGGLLAGLVVSSIVVLLIAAFDHSIRSRRDLTRIGLDNLVGVLPREAQQPDLDLALGALRRTAQTAGFTAIQIVPVAAQPDLADFRREITRMLDGSDTISLRRPLREDAHDTTEAAPSSLSAVAIRWGKDDTNDVIACANALSAIGASSVSVLLYDVPRSEIAHVEA